MRYPSFLRPLGLGLFLLGFAVFIFVLTLGQFELTGALVKQTLKPEHQTALKARLDPLLDKRYTNQFAFISDLRGAINGYNDEQKAKKTGKLSSTTTTFSTSPNAVPLAVLLATASGSGSVSGWRRWGGFFSRYPASTTNLASAMMVSCATPPPMWAGLVLCWVRS